MSDSTDRPNRRPDTPDPEPKSTADASARAAARSLIG